MSDIDYSAYDRNKTDREKIENGFWVPCRICENAFRRLRLTLRYCATCKSGACEGEHMNFADRGRGRCIQCGPKAIEYSGN